MSDISEDACLLCCSEMRDRDFWVGSQHTGRCNTGCRADDCGSGFACRTGEAFLAGIPSEIQVTDSGRELGYTCNPDGSVTENDPNGTPVPTAATTFPTVSPSVSPTNFPTPPTRLPTEAPSRFPINAPTFFPSEAPTSYPTSYPVTSEPTLSPNTFFPFTSSPTVSTTAISSDSGFTNLISSPAGIMVLVLLALCCLCVCGCCVLCCVAFDGKRQDKKEAKRERKANNLAEAKLKGLAVKAKIVDPDFDKFGKPVDNLSIGRKLRGALWRKHENVFSGKSVIKPLKRDFEGQSRLSMAVPVPPAYIKKESFTVSTLATSTDKKDSDLSTIENDTFGDLANMTDKLWKLEEQESVKHRPRRRGTRRTTNTANSTEIGSSLNSEGGTDI